MLLFLLCVLNRNDFVPVIQQQHVSTTSLCLMLFIFIPSNILNRQFIGIKHITIKYIPVSALLVHLIDLQSMVIHHIFYFAI